MCTAAVLRASRRGHSDAAPAAPHSSMPARRVSMHAWTHGNWQTHARSRPRMQAADPPAPSNERSACSHMHVVHLCSVHVVRLCSVHVVMTSAWASSRDAACQQSCERGAAPACRPLHRSTRPLRPHQSQRPQQRRTCSSAGHISQFATAAANCAIWHHRPPHQRSRILNSTTLLVAAPAGRPCSHERKWAAGCGRHRQKGGQEGQQRRLR